MCVLQAKTHYERALAAFQKENGSRFWRAINGDVGGRRCDFVRERLIDIEYQSQGPHHSARTAQCVLSALKCH